MDPVRLIIAALAAGAASGVSEVASTAVKDAYKGLKQLLAARFSGKKAAEVTLAEHEANPQAWQRPLEMAVRETGADADPAVITAAQALMALLDEAGTIAGKYSVTVHEAQGVQVGDHNHQVNQFPAPGPAQPGAEAEIPAPHPATQDMPGAGLSVLWEMAHADPTVGLPRPADSGPQSSPPQPSSPDQVILIERCSGVQLGQDNDQYSVYQVKLPTVALQSGQTLAERLLSQETPWSHDLFSHDAPQVRYSTPGRGFLSASHSITASPYGDTLVIVRNSHGVQVGDHNVQHNQFQIRATSITVHADQLGVTSHREALISQLRENPGDQAAARSLAEDVAQAASMEIIATLTDEVTSTVSPSQIDHWPAEVHDRTGIQIGGPNRASVTVDVAISKWDVTVLERQILKSAESLDELTASYYEPNPPAPRDNSLDHDPSQDDLDPSWDLDPTWDLYPRAPWEL